MIKVNVQKNLIALEDLLVGVGTVEQIRGVTPVTVTKINAGNFPFDGVSTLAQKVATIDAQYNYIVANQAKIDEAIEVFELIQALNTDIVALRAWLVAGNVLSPFQPFLQEVEGTYNLASNLNYTTLDDTVIDEAAVINLGMNSKLFIVKGEELIP